MKNNVIIIILTLVCAFLGWTVYQQNGFASPLQEEISLLKEEIAACAEAAEASSAETFILQELAAKHKAEAEEHRQAAEEHKKIAEDAMEQVEKLKN